MAVKNIFSLNFAKYLSYSEAQKDQKLLMFRSNFSKEGLCSKSITKTLYGNKPPVSERIFKLVCHCESCSWSDIWCA